MIPIMNSSTDTTNTFKKDHNLNSQLTTHKTNHYDLPGLMLFENFTNEINKYNITQEQIEAFLLAARNFTSVTSGSESDLDTTDPIWCREIRPTLQQYESYHGYVSLLICIFGTIANILNIIVLTRKEMCKQPINKILKWLAVADMFVMIEYIPFASYMYIISPVRNGRYTWAIYLLFHMHFTQILHTISISLTVTLAIWRYLAISYFFCRHPHGKISTFVLSHCSEAIIFSFVIAPILCLPTFFVFKVKQLGDETYQVDAQTNTELYSFNFWVHSILIKLLPCCILTVISFILVRVLCEASKRRMKLKEYNNPNPSVSLNGCHSRPSAKCDRRPDRTTMLLVAVLILFLITEFPQGILGLLSGIIGRSFLKGCYTSFGEIMDLLALINAAVGFVLYGLMSKQFRTSFKSLFIKNRLAGIEMTRTTVHKYSI
ncbi:G-protein coupled receptor dmsr-1 isoform X2 [Condylostylus longicornis]|uniref:G-protein coupled receptor dmsr-1 isoform X2 n=1 Tax=Condylostylus longicornis TaxID=2530218 RepID=UPI00244D9BA3|nr:G-protein coupled receptor dmsr-1 isoform X2 [Condylostylus longicornis]